MAGYADSLGICGRISLPGIRSLYGPVSCPVSCFWAGGDYGGFYGGVVCDDALYNMYRNIMCVSGAIQRLARGANMLEDDYLAAYPTPGSDTF